MADSEIVDGVVESAIVEAFELSSNAAYSDPEAGPKPERYVIDGEFVLTEIAKNFQAALAAKGFVIVPREITREMREAFRDIAPHYISYTIINEGWRRAVDAWRAKE